jgi:3'(2'), 5'-bisphosphate nucleotidase
VDLENGGIIVSAVQGGGAFIQALSENALEEPKRLPQKKGPVDIADLLHIEALQSTSMDYDKIHTVCKKLGIGYPGVDLWALQMRYIAMALGGHDALIKIPTYASHRTAVWDQASGQLICEEVGMVMTDLDGNKHDFTKGRRLYDNFGDVVAPAEHHEKILKVVKEVMKQ